MSTSESLPRRFSRRTIVRSLSVAALGVAVAPFVAACGSSTPAAKPAEAAKPAARAAAAQATTAAAAAAPPPVVADEELAVPSDFADEADTAITAANYKAELDSLEAELNAE